MLQALANMPDVRTEVLYVPDVHGVLTPTTDLVFNDAPWMPSNADLHLVHAKISFEVRLHLLLMRCSEKCLNC
jgi:hypothetical protein